jgi:hypothetical protein
MIPAFAHAIMQEIKRGEGGAPKGAAVCPHLFLFALLAKSAKAVADARHADECCHSLALSGALASRRSTAVFAAQINATAKFRATFPGTCARRTPLAVPVQRKHPADRS